MKKTQRLFGLALVLALIVSTCAVFACGGAGQNSYAFVAGNYGGVDADGLWYYGESALNVYHAKEAVDGWKAQLEGASPVIIAVVDTGISVKHEIFEDVLVANENGEPMGYNSVAGADKGNVTDNSTGNHGDKIAGVIAMLIHEFGLENYIKIYPIKASARKTVDGVETDAFAIDSVNEAIKWAANSVHADILNMSLGRVDSETKDRVWSQSTELKMTVKEATKGTLLVAAAGNNYKRADSAADDGAFYPAAYDGVLSVMGYNQSGTLWRVNGGSGSNYGALYDIAAPAESVYSSAGVYGNSAYGYENGTSMASPFVAFAAALLKLRYMAEGYDSVTPYMLSRTLRSLAYSNFEFSSLKIDRLDLYTVANQNLDDVIPEYSAPTGIDIDHNGPLGEGERSDSVYFADPRNVKQIDFLASLTPYGLTDPELEENIEWYVKDYAGVETYLGSGGTLAYTPQVFGDSQIIARLSFDDSVIGVQKIRVDYLPFHAGDAHVTYLQNTDDLPRNAPSQGVLYTGETTRFSITGARYLDPTVEIKWYVNRQYVASGAVFDFKPDKPGDYVIGVQYGDEPATHLPGVAFEAHVKSFILRPLDLSMLIVGVVLFAAAVGLTVFLIIKRKRS